MVASTLNSGQVAVTIDDLPFAYGRYLTPERESECFRAVLAALKKHHVRVIGFANGSRIKPYHRVLFDEFVAAGHVLGNHTCTHPDLNKTAIWWYTDDIAKGQKSIEPWLNGTKYFRYPFLFRGDTPLKRDSVAAYLTRNDYTVVPVTIDDDDWVYNKEYVDTLKAGDRAAAAKIGSEYIEHMKERTHYFDSLAVALTGREVGHILLLHMNELNSIYLDSLLTWFESEDWKCISPQEALIDSIYQMPNRYRGKWGISWLLRIGEQRETGTPPE
jgi:peptidoglycan/xylan/chitin deacetylase (PgdA/CDA1 family)